MPGGAHFWAFSGNPRNGTPAMWMTSILFSAKNNILNSHNDNNINELRNFVPLKLPKFDKKWRFLAK
jgi:hypothetical protein